MRATSDLYRHLDLYRYLNKTGAKSGILLLEFVLKCCTPSRTSVVILTLTWTAVVGTFNSKRDHIILVLFLVGTGR